MRLGGVAKVDVIRFSRINELEIQIRAMQTELGKEAEKYEGFIGKLQGALKKLKEAKNKSRSLHGFQEFD